MHLTVVIIVELHGEVHVVGEDIQVLHKQEELSDEQHRGSLGVLQCDLHLHIVVSVVAQRLCHHLIWRPIECIYANRKSIQTRVCPSLVPSQCI